MARLPQAHVFEARPYNFKVRPPVVAVLHDDGFDLGNKTKWWVLVELPDEIAAVDGGRQEREAGLAKLYDPALARILARWEQVPPDGAKHFAFKPDVHGVFDYTVLVLTDHGPIEAEGESKPKIIIEP